jgi:hypothetical protein
MGRPRWTTRRTVESCLALDVASFRRAGLRSIPMNDDARIALGTREGVWRHES